ncbi:MAG: hypothetical protein IAE79_05605 [Anaerolinea sp.]|nr:hypothetical protein [Anaerolinea sp.]
MTLIEQLSRVAPRRRKMSYDAYLETAGESEIVEWKDGEYWLVDPRPHQEQAEFYVLGEDGTYYPGVIGENGRYHATLFPHFWLDVAWLRQPDLPNPQRALAEIMITVPGLPDDLRNAYQTIYQALQE